MFHSISRGSAVLTCKNQTGQRTGKRAQSKNNATFMKMCLVVSKHFINFGVYQKYPLPSILTFIFMKSLTTLKTPFEINL